MVWFKVDDNLADHPKVRRIPRPARAAAIGLWTLAGSWSARHLTDGRVPDYMIDELAAKPASADALVMVELWHITSHQCEDCPPVAAGFFQFHDWASCQPTKVEVEAERAAARERQRRAREKAKSQRESRRDTSVTHNSTEALVTDLPTRPDPTRPLVLASGGERTETLRAADVTIPPNDEFCTRHPDGNPTNEPCRGCQRVEERKQRHVDRAVAAAAEAAQRSREGCRRCGGSGWIETDDTTPAAKCSHLDVAS